MFTLVIGGAASGKSEYAEELILASPLRPRIYIATMEPFGAEGQARIARHRELRRGKGFQTVERYTVIEGMNLPAVVAVSPDVAVPRIPGMKDILAAGKKPMDVKAAPCVPAATIEVVSCAAPEAAERVCTVLEASADGAIEQFAAALKAAL